MKKTSFKYVWFILVTALLIGLDQVTKVWAVEHLKGQEDIILIKGVFQLHYLENQGMAFGMMQGAQIFFYIMTVCIMAAVLYFLIKTPINKRFMPLYIIEIMVMAGAIGNLIDRSTNQYVVDFLYFSLIDFPVFNVADCYVTVSCFLTAILIFFVYKEEELSEVYSRKKKVVSE